MPKELEITIDSILGGIAPSLGYAGEGQYLAGIGIDLEFPNSDSAALIKPSGWARPTAMEKFSGATMDQTPLWILTNPKSTNIYVYGAGGDLYSYDSDLDNEALVSAIATSGGNGAAYYDNYLYLARNTDVASYGPLNGSPAIDVDAWTTSPLGSQTALTDTTYPSINGVEMPNHVMHRHTDDALYFCDVHSGGYGILNKIKTTKTTVEGDTNDGSTYNALDFDFGLYPTTIETYQTSLAIALIEGLNTTIRQKNAKLSFWDTTSDSFSFITEDEFPDPLITALLNVNGILYVASGSASGGCRISQYVGGYTHKTIWYNQDAYPPFQGAFKHLLDRVVFGSKTTYPEVSASVFAIGSMDGRLSNGVHNIIRATALGNNPMVTAIAYVQNSAFPKLAPIVGWKHDSSQGIDKLSTTYGVALIRFGAFKIGERFEIYQIDIPLGAAITTNMFITPTILVDSETSSTVCRAIHPTNFIASDKKAQIFTRVIGETDFILELRWTGTVLLPVAFPIKIKLRTIHG